MRRRTVLAAALGACVLALAAPPSARAEMLTGADLVHALQAGGLVVVMRHASSPREEPDAATAEPDNPDHERQLDETGRATAEAMGAAIDALGISFDPVYASPAYRARQTVRLLGLGEPTVADELAAAHGMAGPASEDDADWLRARTEVAPPTGSDALLVTHTPNLRAAFGEDAQGLEDGEALVFRPSPPRPPGEVGGPAGAELVARVKIEDWPALAALD